MLRATVSRIDHDGSAVKGVTLATGRSIRADKVVLACGGVGNPRLLLQSGLDAGRLSLSASVSEISGGLPVGG